MGDELEKREIRPAAIWMDREVAADGRVTEIHHHYHAPDPAPVTKPDVAARFTPYFVIMAYLVVIVGSLGIVGMIVVPPFMASMLALTASLVSITVSAVSALIVIAVLAWIIRGMMNDARKTQDHEEC